MTVVVLLVIFADVSVSTITTITHYLSPTPHFSVADETVTLRERDSQSQVRLPIAEVGGVMKGLVEGSLKWSGVCEMYGLLEAKVDEDDAKATSAPAQKAAPNAAPKASADDELDFGFDDDDDAPKSAPIGGKSRSEVAAELKAKRDADLEEKKKEAEARLAKKEANQRSLCNLEIKPWEAEQDLLALYAKIKATVVRDGLKWSENCALVDVAFGIKKIVCTAVIPLALSMDEIIEEMTEETFTQEIQSMQMTSMSLL
jgi:translation elongation factor EF-1beta